MNLETITAWIFDPDDKLPDFLGNDPRCHLHQYSSPEHFPHSSGLPDLLVFAGQPQLDALPWLNWRLLFPQARFVLAVAVEHILVAAQNLPDGLDGYILYPYQPGEWQRLIRDTLSRKQVATQAHQISEHAMLDHTINYAPDAVIGLDAKGRVVAFNSHAAKILGYTREEALTKHVNELYEEGHEESHRVMSALRHSADGQLRHYETTVRHADGQTIIPIRLTAIMMRDEQSQVQRTYGFFHDLREDLIQVEKIALELYGSGNENYPARVARILMAETMAEMCLVFRFNHHSVKLEVVEYAGPTIEGLLGTSYLLTGFLAELFRNSQGGQRLRRSELPSLTQEPLFIRLAESSQHGNISSCLALPLAFRDAGATQPFGLLLLVNKQHQGGIDQNGFSWTHQIWLQMLEGPVVNLIQHDWHRQSLDALVGSAKLLADGQNEQAVLNHMMEVLVQKMGYRAAYIRLVKPDKSLPIWAEAGAVPKQRRFATTPAGYGIVGVVIEKGETAIVPDINLDERFWFRELAEEQQWRGLLGIPIKAQERTIGVLVCSTAIPHKFTPQEVAIVTGFANLAALALNSALLSEQQAQTQDLYRNVIQIMGSQSLESAWHAILHEAMRLTGAERGSINRVDTKSGWVNPPLVHLGFSEEYSRTAHGIGDEKSIVGWVADKKLTVIIYDIENEPEWKKIYYPGASDTRSELTAPIFATDSDEVVGIINLESPRIGAFTSEHQRMLEAIAVYPKIVHDSPLLSEHLRRKQSRNRAMRKASSALVEAHLTGLTQEAAIQVIISEAVNVTGAKFGTLHLIERDGQQLELKGVYPANLLEDHLTRKELIALSGSAGLNSPILQALQFHHSQLIGDAQQEGYLAFHTTSRAALAVYFGDGERVHGVFNVEHTQPGKFTEEDRDTLVALANLALISLELVQRAGELANEQQRVSRLHLLSRAVRLQAVSAPVHQIANHTYRISGWLENAQTALTHKQNHLVPGYLQKVSSSVEALRQEVEQLWQYKQAVKPQRIVILPFLTEEIAKWRSAFDDVVFTFQSNLVDTTVAINGRPMEIRSALRILIDNAERASQANPNLAQKQIALTLSQVNDSVEIVISDNGVGIGDDIVSKLGKEVISNASGSGTGAIIAATIIEDEHRGELRWENLKPLGARTTVYFPIAQTGEEETNESH